MVGASIFRAIPRSTSSLLLGALISLVPAWAAAAGPSDGAARALDRFREGAAAYDEGRYADAIELFLEADRLATDPAFAYNTARTYERMGDRSNALRWYREYRRRAAGAADLVLVAATITKLEQGLARKGVQQISVLSEPSGATVSLDERPVGVTPWSGDLAPGHHDVDLRLSGYEAVSAPFELEPNHSRDLRFVLHEDDPLPVPLALPWVTLGLGAAGLAAALGCELAGSSAERDARGAGTAAEAADATGRAQDLRLAARVLGVAGAAVTLGAAVMVMVDLTAAPHAESDDEQPASVAVQVGCRGGGCGLGLSGQF